MKKEELKSTIRNVPDFPIKGIQFKDLTTMFMNASALKAAVDDLYEEYKDKGITKVVGLESRGFIIGPALAIRLNAGFIPIRKPGKLPYNTMKIEYKKEYGTDTIEIHTDSIEEKDVVLIHDDLLATGGTAEAAIKLVEKMKPQKIYACFIVELDNLKGRERVKCPTYSTLHYNE